MGVAAHTVAIIEGVIVKVLVADDDVMARAMLQAALTDAGHEVIVAVDGSQAWELLSQDRALSLAVVDWMMPGLDGIALCRKARTLPREVYIILLTSRDSEYDIISAITAGVDDYIVKPFESSDLSIRIRAGQRIVQLRRELRKAQKQLGSAEKRLAELETRIRTAREALGQQD